MEGKVLIVDRDPDLVGIVQENLNSHKPEFGVLAATDHKSVVKALKSEPVTLVLYDLKVPKASDIELLRNVCRFYPDVEIIALTGLSGEELQRMIGQGATLQCIEQPYAIDEILAVVKRALDKQCEGGVLYNVSAGMFLQLIEMEQRTCTIRLVENGTKKMGALFFREGILFDARSNGMRGEEAAYEIFSWERVCLWIQNTCCPVERRIARDLQAVILEAMRRKDEAIGSDEDEEEDLTEAEVIVPAEETVESKAVAKLKKRLEAESGYYDDVIDIREDASWDSLLAQTSRIGAFFDAGELKVAYVDRGDTIDYLLIPDQQTIVVTLDPKCPRDKFIKLVMGQ